MGLVYMRGMLQHSCSIPNGLHVIFWLFPGTSNTPPLFTNGRKARIHTLTTGLQSNWILCGQVDKGTQSFLCFAGRVEAVSNSSQEQLFGFEEATTSSSLKKASVYFIYLYLNPNNNVNLSEELSIKSPDTGGE